MILCCINNVMVLFCFAFNKPSGNTHCCCSKSIFILINVKNVCLLKILVSNGLLQNLQ